MTTGEHLYDYDIREDVAGVWWWVATLRAPSAEAAEAAWAETKPGRPFRVMPGRIPVTREPRQPS